MPTWLSRRLRCLLAACSLQSTPSASASLRRPAPVHRDALGQPRSSACAGAEPQPTADGSILPAPTASDPTRISYTRERRGGGGRLGTSWSSSSPTSAPRSCRSSSCAGRPRSTSTSSWPRSSRPRSASARVATRSSRTGRSGSRARASTGSRPARPRWAGDRSCRRDAHHPGRWRRGRRRPGLLRPADPQRRGAAPERRQPGLARRLTVPVTRAILPAWTEPDPALHAPPGRGDRPRIARCWPRWSGSCRCPASGSPTSGPGSATTRCSWRSEPAGPTASNRTRSLLDEARQRASAAHQPNLRIVEGGLDLLPLRDGAVDIVLSGLIEANDASLPGIAELLRVIRPGGRLVVIGYYGRDEVAGAAGAGGGGPCLRCDAAADRLVAAPRVQDQGRPQPPRHLAIRRPPCESCRGSTGTAARAFLMAPHPPFLTLKLGLFHLAKR